MPKEMTAVSKLVPCGPDEFENQVTIFDETGSEVACVVSDASTDDIMAAFTSGELTQLDW